MEDGTYLIRLGVVQVKAASEEKAVEKFNRMMENDRPVVVDVEKLE